MFRCLINFRDLSTADPLRVRPGRVFRSDTLSRMDEADWQRFAELGVRTVLDLRTSGEVRRYGRVRADTGIDYHHLPVLKTDWDEHPYSPGTSVAHYLADRYLELAGEGADELGAALTVLADPAAAPVVLHCGSGRDRAGVLAALTLGLLEVGDDAIAADYARSGESSDRAAALIGPGFVHSPEYAQTPAEAMLLTLGGLREHYGSLIAYAEEIGVPATAVTSLRRHLTVG